MEDAVTFAYQTLVAVSVPVLKESDLYLETHTPVKAVNVCFTSFFQQF